MQFQIWNTNRRVVKLQNKEGDACRLMLAALANHRQNRQIRDGIKPLVRCTARCFGGSFSGLPQMPHAREVPQVLQADSGQPGYLFLGKDLLARSDRQAAHI